MVISKSELAEKIRACGLKPTEQRMAILKNLLSRKDHPSADAVYQVMKHDYPTLSLNTIYLNLMNFAQRGIISKINILHDAARFDGDINPHHHFVCVRCKKIIDLHNVRIPRITLPKGLGAATIFHQQLRLNGICQTCKQNETGSADTLRKTARDAIPAS